MRLNEDAIIIESRYEIDDIIKMIEIYQQSGNQPESLTQEELNRLKDQLNVLYMCW